LLGRPTQAVRYSLSICMDSTLRKVGVAQNQPSYRVEPVDLLRRELAKGVPIASPRQLDEFLAHAV
jgi:hypothetical protein